VHHYSRGGGIANDVVRILAMEIVTVGVGMALRKLRPISTSRKKKVQTAR